METIEKLKEVVDNLNEKIWGEYGEHEDNVWYFFTLCIHQAINQ